MKEIWKNIEGYEGLYQVSNLGRVKSLERIMFFGRTSKYKIKEKILKQKKDKRNYMRVILSKNGKTKTFLVHRLVAKMFIKNTYNKPYINHKDENPSNNIVDNLEWVTNGENLKYKDCLKKGKREKQGKSVIQYNLSNKKIKEYGSLAEASEKTKINKNNIRNNCKKRSKTAGGYIWEYKN